jgi:hypothetical protein
MGLPASTHAAQVTITGPPAIPAAVSPACQSAPPFNIDPGMLRSQFIELLQRSATFRRQCARIASTRVLRVTLRVRASLTERGAQALTIVDRYETGAIRADVTLLLGRNYLEMLAHEFEHILEQVDGVVLGDEVARGRAWRRGTGTFETRRAFDAGVRALQEYSVQAARARSPR